MKDDFPNEVILEFKLSQTERNRKDSLQRQTTFAEGRFLQNFVYVKREREQLEFRVFCR